MSTSTTPTIATTIAPTLTTLTTVDPPAYMTKSQSVKIPANKNYRIEATINSGNDQAVFFKFKEKTQPNFGYTATSTGGQMLGELKPIEFTGAKEETLEIYIGTTFANGAQSNMHIMETQTVKVPTKSPNSQVTVFNAEDFGQSGPYDAMDSIVSVIIDL